MSKFRGTVKKNDLEGGFWELTCSDGQRYQLQGGDAGLQVEGQEVEVEGDVASNTMGIGMVGSILNVKSWKKS